MKHQCLSLRDYLASFFLCQLLHPFILQIGIQAIQIVAHIYFLQQFHCCCRQKISIEVASCQDHYDLQADCDHLGNRDDIGLDIILLLGIDQTVFICNKIGADRIKQKDKVIQCQIPDCHTIRLLHQIGQKW